MILCGIREEKDIEVRGSVHVCTFYLLNILSWLSILVMRLFLFFFSFNYFTELCLFIWDALTGCLYLLFAWDRICLRYGTAFYICLRRFFCYSTLGAILDSGLGLFGIKRNSSTFWISNSCLLDALEWLLIVLVVESKPCGVFNSCELNMTDVVYEFGLSEACIASYSLRGLFPTEGRLTRGCFSGCLGIA